LTLSGLPDTDRSISTLKPDSVRRTCQRLEIKIYYFANPYQGVYMSVYEYSKGFC